MWLELLQSLAGVLLLGALSTALALHGWHRNTFLASTGGGSADGAPLPLQGRRIGLVIAHPDDESMFFVPTLSHLREEGSHAVHILCLSTGNADGLGTTRTAELRAAASLLGVPPARLRIVDDQTNLADGMRSRWSVKVARGHIERFVDDHRIDTVRQRHAHPPRSPQQHERRRVGALDIAHTLVLFRCLCVRHSC